MSKILTNCQECLAELDDRHFDGCTLERTGRLLLDKMYNLGQPLTWNTVATATDEYGPDDFPDAYL